MAPTGPQTESPRIATEAKQRGGTLRSCDNDYHNYQTVYCVGLHHTPENYGARCVNLHSLHLCSVSTPPAYSKLHAR